VKLVYRGRLELRERKFCLVQATRADFKAGSEKEEKQRPEKGKKKEALGRIGMSKGNLGGWGTPLRKPGKGISFGGNVG